MNTELLLDMLLAAGALTLAGLSLLARQVFTAILLYISMGLLVTIIWVRLNAWDVAIAEAAIGAGLTGALLLIAWRRLADEDALQTSQPAEFKEVDDVPET
ncbi:MAG: hypothetical protein AseanaTS_07340 [Candidatus Pelagadaptatus aseana]|uniref:DUF4040 domain-containing protein n=1 Tax=Candidatus Pelagadaptatus aseana TaxID=3120508 RepID=UPI0039B13D89